MANELVLAQEIEPPILFTVANATGIAKGALCKLADPATASLANGSNDIIAGVAATEKIASDGITTLGFYRRGIFIASASGAITVGDPLGSNGTYPNYVQSVATTANLSGSKVIGFALETATNNETLLIELNITQGI